ncbi:kinase-like protein [Byssothecium circinans]|uniref:non-specific serine/threonine protein kinase n=1 Tax=Byssothecium circinans TaxID=147558 RepID=A0A6A5UEX5_9PLEO|nr:kinase-like protein [Byssothecium circinans]
MPPSSAAEARRLRARIQEHLAHHVVNPRKPSYAYIPYQHVERAWSGHDVIETALHSSHLSSAQVEEIRAKLLRFLSILVYIDAHDFLDNLSQQAFKDNGTLRSRNCDLPLGEEDAPDLGAFMLRQRFLNEQYLFIPEVIHESAMVEQIDDRRRLPFESIKRNVSAGAYGTVDKIGLSPNHLKKLDGGTYPSVKYVACKRFHSQLASSRYTSKWELDNLQILKESITSHSNIRLHLAILLHQGEHLILLPWADHLDLDFFLLEGHDFLGREIYKFGLRFPNIQPSTILDDVCVQMHHIAHAIDWLHRGVTTQGSHQNKIRFAHMDLKPNNILIDNDGGPSTVGKWVLTDFGISAFKEDEDSDEVNFVSIGDYYQNHTINTVQRRDPGAYQPPEVESEQGASHGRRNDATEGSVGRRGDIWSFGCIFSEVLAFSLGQTSLVKEFRISRQGSLKNDYFYEAEDEMLKINTTYRARPAIVNWLRALPQRYTFPKRAIGCCAETIQRILIVDGSKRPRASELLNMLNHVSNHIKAARSPGYPPNCPLERPSPHLLPAPPEPASVPTRIPSIRRINSIGDQFILSDRLVNESGTGSREYFDAVNAPSHMPPRDLDFEVHPRDREDSLLDPESAKRHQGEANAGLGIFKDPFTNSTPPDPGKLFDVPRPASRESRKDLFGIVVNPKTVRKAQKPLQLGLPGGLGKAKVISFSLCPSGANVAYLTESKGLNHELHLYSIPQPHDRTKRDLVGSNWQHSAKFSLSIDVAWEHVMSSGQTVVAWGNTRDGTKQAHLSNELSRITLDASKSSWLASLLMVAVSKRGSVAFVSGKSIHYAVIEQERTAAIDHEDTIRAKEDHTFTHAEFNDDGSLLYAWEFGRPDDCLTVWRIGEDGKPVRPPDSEGSYETKQQGSPTATLTPYNTYHGCIIRAQNGVFFPSQIRSTQRGSQQTLPKKTVTLSKTIAVCMYGDHSLLVAEKGFRHTRIREHRIVGGSMHVIEENKSKAPVVVLGTSLDKGTQMRVVHSPHSEDLEIVVCGADGKVYVVPVIA